MRTQVRRGSSRRSTAAAAEGRTPLNRQRVLDAALRYVDGHGLAGLSMRKLAAELGVEAMSLYNHVDGKSGLYDGIVELLWQETEEASTPAVDEDWRDALRRLAHATHDMISKHPRAAPLLTSRHLMPESALRLFGVHLKVLRGAGVAEERAGEALRTVFSYAMGCAFSDVATYADGAVPEDESELQRLRRIDRWVPEGVSDELFQVAVTICECDMDLQFERGLDLLIRGVAVDPE